MNAPAPSLGRPTAAEGDLRLPRPPGIFRRFWARHPWLTDSLIAGCYALPAFLSSLTITTQPLFAANLVAGIGAPFVAAASVAAVLFRRRAPVTMLAVALAAMAVTLSGAAAFLGAGVCALLYTVAVYVSVRAAWIGFGASIAVLVVADAVTLVAAARDTGSSNTEIGWGFLMLIAVLIGINVGNRRRYLAALIDRAAQLARERDQQAQLATAAERARIAREMHDIVSHSLTVMITLADGSAALAGTAPARAEDAMRQVAETGRHALTDMRRMLGVLSEGAATAPSHELPADAEAEREPQPSAAELTTLIERFRAAGLPVRYTVTGEAPPDPVLQLTVFRVVQEALTNVLRHAPGAGRVTVAIEYTETITVRVENDAPVVVTRTDLEGAGRGLVGLRERVALYGGTLEAGPAVSGGWLVVATLNPKQDNPTQEKR